MSAIGAEEDGKVYGYMCLTDYECEMGLASCGHTIYPTAELLRGRRSCVPQCGIAYVSVELVRIEQGPDYSELDNETPT